MAVSRSKFIASLSALSLASCARSVGPPQLAQSERLLSAADTGSSFDFGAALDVKTPVHALAMLPPQALYDLPIFSSRSRVVLPAIPPVVAQGGTTSKLGSPGTCEAQSFGYGLGSSVSARDSFGIPIRDVSLKANQASRAFLYAKQIHQFDKPCGDTGAFWYLNELVLNGSPSESQVPYEPDCAYLTALPTNTEPPNAGHFHIAGFSTRQVGKNPMTELLPIMKAVLASGFPIAFSGLVPQDYAAPELVDGVYYPPGFVPDSGHGQLIVGYDDEIGSSANGLGAFLVQNSFGTLWPFQSANPAGPGRIWYSYAGFFAGQKTMATAYPVGPAFPFFGSALRSTKNGAPQVRITRAYQWSPDGVNVYLMLQLAFAQPMRLSGLSITEPAPGSAAASGSYGSDFILQNYAFFQRSDGHAFLPGEYTVTLSAALASSQADPGVSYAYQGTTFVIPPLRFDLAPASMSGVLILDPTLVPALVS